MWKKLFVALLVILLLLKVRSQSLTDMGDCACVCGLNSEGNIEGGVATVRNKFSFVVTKTFLWTG